MGMKNYLKGLKTKVEVLSEGYTVIYEINEKVGRCTYKEFNLPGLRKPLKQSDYILTHVEFSPIIEELNKEYNFNEGDLEVLQRQIREDSLRILKDSQ